MLTARKELEPGFEIPPLTKRAFMIARGGIHGDEYAQQMGFARGLVVGGTTLAYMTEMLTSFFGQSWFETGKISVTFTRPVFENDMVTCRGVVKEKAAEDSGVRLVLDIWMEKEDGEKVIVGTASARVQ